MPSVPFVHCCSTNHPTTYFAHKSVIWAGLARQLLPALLCQLGQLQGGARLLLHLTPCWPPSLSLWVAGDLDFLRAGSGLPAKRMRWTLDCLSGPSLGVSLHPSLEANNQGWSMFKERGFRFLATPFLKLHFKNHVKNLLHTLFHFNHF